MHNFRLLESGFIPGGLFTLSLWYKGGELSKRFALYFIGNGLATAAGGLLAYAMCVTPTKSRRSLDTNRLLQSSYARCCRIGGLAMALHCE